jgi:cytochrome c-type biogenesis protein CcmH/NrfF
MYFEDETTTRVSLIGIVVVLLVLGGLIWLGSSSSQKTKEKSLPSEDQSTTGQSKLPEMK